MKFTQKKLKNSQLELTVEFSAEDLKKYRQEVIKETSTQVNIPGFRKGHIPENILINQVGADFIEMETKKQAINKSYKKIINENKITPVNQAQIDIKNSDEKKESDIFIYTAIIDVYPEIDLADYKKVKVKLKKPNITKKEIDKVIIELQEQVATYKTVERACKKGDTVIVDFAGYSLKDEPIPNTSAKKQKIELGKKQFIPGFEEEVEKMKANEEKKFKIKFPKDYHEKTMANNEYYFIVTLHEVQEKILDELNDDFVKKITGKKDSIEKLKEDIKKNLENKQNNENRKKAEEEVIKEFLKKIKVDTPLSFINKEKEFLIDNIKLQGLQQGHIWEKYLQLLGKTEEELKKDLEKEAINRVQGRLIVEEIILKENIKVDEKEVEIQSLATYHHDKQRNPKIKIQDYNLGGKQYENIKNILITKKVFDSFIEEEN